jgi:site-specific recombinase XerD
MAIIAASRQQDFFFLFEKFIADSKTGKRVQPNGKPFTSGTIANYTATMNMIKAFSETKSFPMRIRNMRQLNARETIVEKNYWKRFYKKFCDYLYKDKGFFDNYAGLCIKNIKVFFSYLNKHTNVSTGDVSKLFYVTKEEIAIHPLMPEELNFLIYNKEFEEKLSPKMKQVKDVFVFGCTVALRVSDLIALKKTNLRIVNNQYYLAVRSIKTSSDSLVKLPDYAIEILNKYGKLKGRILPAFNKSNLNHYIKELLELAGFTQVVSKGRERRGKFIELKNEAIKAQKHFRFCDVASTHTMRRTAITTMLCLGMPEQLVRRVSGHAPNSKEFYRYVLWAQTYQDQETEKAFDKLKTRVSQPV